METTDARPPPWRWMILLSRFFMSFLVLGIIKSLGLFLPYLVETFGVSMTYVGFVCSSLMGLGMLTCGPIAGAVLKVWSPRRVSVLGGLLTGSCLMVAPFSASFVQLLFVFGLASVGMAFTQIASVPPLMDYFSDDFAFANGISLAGGTLGMMTLPLIAEYLLSLYGWREAFGLLGALSFNLVVCAALLRPLEMSAYRHVPTAAGPEDVDSTTMPRPDAVGDGAEKDEATRPFFSHILTSARECLDTEVLSKPDFLLFQAVSIMEGMSFSVWHIFLVAQGVELGYGEVASAALATFGGFGSMVGRLTNGTLVDREVLQPTSLFVLSSLLFAVSNLLDPLAAASFTTLALTACASGLGIGIFYPLTFVLMREITGDKHTSAYGWLFTSHGAGQILGGIMAGWIHDVAHSYTVVFFAVGANAFTMATVAMLMRYVMKCLNKRGS